MVVVVKPLYMYGLHYTGKLLQQMLSLQ